MTKRMIIAVVILLAALSVGCDATPNVPAIATSSDAAKKTIPPGLYYFQWSETAKQQWEAGYVDKAQVAGFQMDVLWSQVDPKASDDMTGADLNLSAVIAFLDWCQAQGVKGVIRTQIYQNHGACNVPAAIANGCIQPDIGALGSAFKMPNYRNAIMLKKWRDFHVKLASRIDGHPALVLVQGGTGLYGEMMFEDRGYYPVAGWSWDATFNAIAGPVPWLDFVKATAEGLTTGFRQTHVVVCAWPTWGVTANNRTERGEYEAFVPAGLGVQSNGWGLNEAAGTGTAPKFYDVEWDGGHADGIFQPVLDGYWRGSPVGDERGKQFYPWDRQFCNVDSYGVYCPVPYWQYAVALNDHAWYLFPPNYDGETWSGSGSGVVRYPYRWGNFGYPQSGAPWAAETGQMNAWAVARLGVTAESAPDAWTIFFHNPTWTSGGATASIYHPTLSQFQRALFWTNDAGASSPWGYGLIDSLMVARGRFTETFDIPIPGTQWALAGDTDAVAPWFEGRNPYQSTPTNGLMWMDVDDNFAARGNDNGSRWTLEAWMEGKGSVRVTWAGCDGRVRSLDIPVPAKWARVAQELPDFCAKNALPVSGASAGADYLVDALGNVVTLHRLAISFAPGEATATPTPSHTSTCTVTSTATGTPSVTFTATASRTFTPSATPSPIRTNTPSATASRTATASATWTATATPSPTETVTATPTPTGTREPDIVISAFKKWLIRIYIDKIGG